MPALVLTMEQWQQMRSHLDSHLPEEACGILAGTNNLVLSVLPLTNSLHSATGYRIDPQEQFNAFQWMEENGQELLAIFHSHPLGPETPSLTDIEQAYYPESAYLIWSRSGGVWICRAYRIIEGQAYEVSLQFVHPE